MHRIVPQLIQKLYLKGYFMAQQMHVTVLEFIAQESARIIKWWQMLSATKTKRLLAVQM